jgi:hypothetical protein
MNMIALEPHTYLTLAGLRRILNELDQSPGRWWLEDPAVLHRRNLPSGVTGMIEVFHCEDGRDQATGELSFLIPAYSPSESADEGCILVRLAPELIQPGITGLYIENGCAVTDFMEDWHRFWNPLKTALSEKMSEKTSAFRSSSSAAFF